MSRLSPQSAQSFADSVTRAGWQSIGSSYLVCDNDRSMPPAAQNQLASRTDTVHHLSSGHSPFLSMPGELADLLSRIATPDAPHEPGAA